MLHGFPRAGLSANKQKVNIVYAKRIVSDEFRLLI
jgi:hypothetical protein